MRGERSITESSGVESSIVIASEQKLAWQSTKNTNNTTDSELDSEIIDCHSPKELRNDIASFSIDLKSDTSSLRASENECGNPKRQADSIDCHSPKGLRNDKHAVDCHDFASAKSRNDKDLNRKSSGVATFANIESSDMESSRNLDSKAILESAASKSRTAKQLILYFVIGGLITLCELAGFYVLYKFFGLHYILASLLMFVLASAAGIALYRRFIFGASCLHSSLEIGASYLINTIGVGINTLILWLLVEFAGLEAIYAKVIASLLVAFYGFYARKILIYKKGK